MFAAAKARAAFQSRGEARRRGPTGVAHASDIGHRRGRRVPRAGVDGKCRGRDRSLRGRCPGRDPGAVVFARRAASLGARTPRPHRRKRDDCEHGERPGPIDDRRPRRQTRFWRKANRRSYLLGSFASASGFETGGVEDRAGQRLPRRVRDLRGPDLHGRLQPDPAFRAEDGLLGWRPAIDLSAHPSEVVEAGADNDRWNRPRDSQPELDRGLPLRLRPRSSRLPM